MPACLRCGRFARHAVFDPDVPYPQEFCSDNCIEAGQMVDPTESEIKAMEDAGMAGGAYLDSLGKSDLGRLSPDEWMTFVEAVVTGFVEHMQNEPPF